MQAKVKEWINEFEIGQAMPAQFSEALEKIQQPLVAKSAGLQKQQSMAAKSSIEEQPLLTQLSWPHYENLMRVPDLEMRQWYIQEATAEQRNYASNPAAQSELAELIPH